VLVSRADWQLRLRRFAPALRLGFDIMWVDWSAVARARDPREFPKTVGAYGYLDDHPIAGNKIWSPAVYLENRCEAMLGLVPGVEIWYVRHTFIKRCLDDGFNLAAFLSARGIQLDAWTMDGAGRVDANALPLARGWACSRPTRPRPCGNCSRFDTFGEITLPARSAGSVISPIFQRSFAIRILAAR
jgi:hypothetical protein